MHYNVAKNASYSRVAVHLGIHNHPIANGEGGEALDLIRYEIMTQVARIPNTTAISIVVKKELLLKGLLNKDGGECMLMESELVQVFDKWAKLSTLSNQNMISEARRFCGQSGYIDNILKLKKASTYDFTHALFLYSLYSCKILSSFHTQLSIIS